MRLITAQSRPSVSDPGHWIVHISLLPQTSPFPFERGSNFYNRCLSRGLYQLVAIDGSSEEAVESGVMQAFGRLLKGRPWMPLQAHIPDNEDNQGVPELRQPDPDLLGSKWDVEFLRAHCVVPDMDGETDSLYIALQYSSLSWRDLSREPIYLSGLEESWRIRGNWYCCQCEASKGGLLQNPNSQWSSSCEEMGCGHTKCPNCTEASHESTRANGYSIVA